MSCSPLPRSGGEGGRKPIAERRSPLRKPFSNWRRFEQRQKRSPRRKLFVEQLEERSLLSATLVTVETEPNNDEAHANLLAPNALVSGVLDTPGDVDFFALHVSESGLLEISVTPRNGSAVDTRVALYNSN